ncbi:MAG: phage tail sheath subtilisin-like domain-containing protein [Gammaproteobacteria bacterium]|nr:phage tail sheath subtilisin-like domain-containing protein [Gammaproteobacteria bacterium]
MSPSPTYPGVYIEEVDGTMREIVGVDTSMTAFIGSTPRGVENEPVEVTGFADFTRVFGNLSADHPMGFAVNQYFQNGGGRALVIRVTNGARAATGSADTLNLVAASAGAWGMGLTISITHPDPVLFPDAAADELFNLSVTDSSTGAMETFENVSVLSDHSRLVTTKLEQHSNLVRIAGTLPPARPAQVNGVAFNADGADGLTITDAQISGPALAASRHGLWALEKAGLFNLLCIPPFSLDAAGDIGAQTRSAAARYCLDRRAIFIADPLHAWSGASDLTDPVTGLDGAAWGMARNANTALYYPRIIQPNPLLGGQLSEFAPCGAIAGIIVRTDTKRGVWKAPAGRDAVLSSVAALALDISQADNGVLNEQGVNCLRSLPGIGRVVWGSRTLAGSNRQASEWKYLPVRRTALYIEESLFRGTHWAVFEPNDERLWARIRLAAGAFMQGLFRQGAFQGTSPKEAFFVKCDSETNSRSDIDNGILNLLVGFAPLKPAEFVVIKIQKTAGQTGT